MARSGVEVKVNAKALREARLAAFLTQKDLADAVGLTNLQISRLETGIQNSTVNNLRKVAEQLGIPLESLIV